MHTFKAFRIHQDDGRIVARFDTIGLDDLAAGEVVIRVQYSDINFKDALAATGTSPILRRSSAASISPVKSCRRATRAMHRARPWP
jgi:NADPH:quinone reductase-like Zn-dependent oxidoreductase